jgi:hypothetical protein
VTDRRREHERWEALLASWEVERAASVAGCVVERSVALSRSVTRSAEIMAADVFDRATEFLWAVADRRTPADEERIAVLARLSPLVAGSLRTTKDPTTGFLAKGITAP